MGWMGSVVTEPFESIHRERNRELCTASWSRLKSNLVKVSGPGFPIVDLFCGCGGLSLGAFEAVKALSQSPYIAYALDMHDPSLQVYRRNFDVSPRLTPCQDIQGSIDGEFGQPATRNELAILDVIDRPKLLLAGPPCQGHSDLNNRTRRNDPRNNLYLRVVRFAELSQPEFVCIENVPGALHDKTRVVQEAEHNLSMLGYKTQTLIVSGSHVGLPQRRRRLVLLGTRQLTALPIHLTQIRPNAPIEDWIGDLQCEYLNSTDLFGTPSKMTDINRHRSDYLYENDVYELPNSFRPSCHRDKDHSYNSVYGRLNWGVPAPTITTGFGCMGQGRFLHPEERRVLTPHEAARLQTFPDFFSFSGVASRRDLQKMIGNAVPPKMAATILFALLAGTYG